MLEGLSGLISRVRELQTALDSWSGQSQSSQSTGGSGSAAGSSTSFQRALQKAQTPPPAHPIVLGTGGATQMPGSASPDLAPGEFGLPGTSGLSGLGIGGGSFGLTTNGLMDGGSPSGDQTLLGGFPGSGLGGSSLSSPLASLQGNGASSDNGLLGMIDGVASQVGVDPALAKAVAQAESGLNPNAVSPAGATGLMQLMPGTFQQYAQAAVQTTPAGLPLRGTITQTFGPTSLGTEPPLEWNGTYYRHFHTGIDIGAPSGTPIRATISGTVQLRQDPEGYGNLIVVSNGPWDVLYGHTNGHPSTIRTGAFVKAGEVLGYTGSTGNSTGPHVHYEVRYNGQIIDPTPFASRSGTMANPQDPVANATAGVSYLKDLLTRFNNDVPKALAAYNAGPAAVQKYGGVPPYPETQAYVQKALQYARDYGA